MFFKTYCLNYVFHYAASTLFRTLLFISYDNHIIIDLIVNVKCFRSATKYFPSLNGCMFSFKNFLIPVFKPAFIIFPLFPIFVHKSFVFGI